MYPEFRICNSKDLMIRGRSFYAVWDEDTGLWSQNEKDVCYKVDKELHEQYEYAKTANPTMSVEYMADFSTNHWSQWQKFCKSCPDNYHELDSHVVFSNTEIVKEDYVTRKLEYPLERTPIPSYERIMSVLYDDTERQKIEWAIGAIISGDSKKIQKFLVFYGAPKTGKSTILNIIQSLFQGYYSTFEASVLTSRSSDFALEAFRNNPLVAIQHDGDLSRIEDNTKLNSIVSHETMMVNEKFKSAYQNRFHSFLFMGTNKPVRITDGKSGILRRLIDVNPTGERIPEEEYDILIDKIPFELPGIAHHCLKVYEELGRRYYDSYVPTSMIGKTNDIYNFIESNYDFFCDDEDGVDLRETWLRYKAYCDDTKVPYPLSMRQLRNELESYFKDFKERSGNRYSIFYNFIRDKFRNMEDIENILSEVELSTWLKFESSGTCEFDDILKDCPAQYASGDGKPISAWDKVKTKLQDLDTRKLHYVLPPENLIMIDFDLKNESGEKDFELNRKEAEKWPVTYAELSKSGGGIHLYYYYNGDPNTLARLYDKDIEIKVSKGKSSIRRKLIKYTSYAIATISSGLPLKEVKNVIKSDVIRSERSLRNIIIRNLKKEIHPATKPSMDFIYKILDDAYNNGLRYDVTDMRPAIQQFAMSSTNQAEYCIRLISKMKFKSEEPSDGVNGSDKDGPIIFFDVEVFPNLFVLVWKKQGPNQKFVKMINPTSSEIEALTYMRLVGFNCRRYDNSIAYGRMMGYTNQQLFELSQRIVVKKEKNALFGEAYNLSYTDIYDFLSAANKMSLKKWEIKLGIHHQELGLPWDKPVPEERWDEVADYCTNDVGATEAVWDANQADWHAREILADWACMTVNDTTNSLTTRLIVGRDQNPQNQFIYTDLSTIYPGYEYNAYGIDKSRYKEGVKIVKGKSIYKGVDPGEGGRVFANPGIWINVGLLDVTSMHPHSAIKLKVFGDAYTKNFEALVEARICIKHGDYEGAKKFLPERVWKYLDDPEMAKALADALKTAINSVYGLTSASFPNKLRDPRNVDNIVAKYGALFMIDLQEEVEKRGYTVVHIKTDSIKIADVDQDIIDFCMEFAKGYGFTFEHEDTYEKLCLVNESTYIAKYKTPKKDKKTGKMKYWTATGDQFKVPYVFKSLFSHEDIEFDDVCETKTVDKGVIYLDCNERLDDVSEFEHELNKLETAYKKGKISDTMFEAEAGNLVSEIEKGHDYRFIGKVGGFCPVKDGYDGGYLVRQVNDKYYAVNDTKKKHGGGAYRWLESETVKNLGEDFMNIIDTNYYEDLVSNAKNTIEKYCDFEWFVSDDILIPDSVMVENFPMNKPEFA